MPHKSTFNDVDIPNADLITFLFKNIKDYENNIALVDDDTGREITYNDLYKSIRHVASGLHSRGFQQKDYLCIYASERIDWVIAALAAVALGGVFSGCNFRYPAAELLHHVETVGGRFFICSADLVEPTRNLTKQYTKFKEVFVFGDAVAGFTPFSELLKHDDVLSDLNVKIDPMNDVCSVCFSSGTTGVPKGIQIGHRSLVGNVCQVSHPDITKLDGTKRVFTGDPPFLHLAGQVLMLSQPLHLGAKIVILSMHKDVDVKFERFLRATEKHKISVANFLPYMGGNLVKNPLVDKTDLSSLTCVRLTGAPVGATLQQCMIDKFPKSTHMGNLYGTTEAMVMSCTVHSKKIKPGSVGMLLPNTQAKIIDVSTSKELTEPFAKGEFYIRSPSLFKGYLNKPDLTAQALDEEGYYRTGDIAYFDDEGYLFVVDRVKDVMFFNGSNIWPSDLEDLIKCHPDVVDVGVVGFPNPPDDLPKAFVVKKEGTALTEDDVVSFVKENVAPERYLRGGVQFLDNIPRTLSGKIMRKELRKI